MLNRQPKAWGPYLQADNGTVLCDNMLRNLATFEEMIARGSLTKENFAEAGLNILQKWS